MMPFDFLNLSLNLTLLCVFGVISGVASHPVSASAKSEYLRQRASLIQEDSSRMLGSKIVLTPEEQIVNEVMLKEKRKHFDSSRLNKTRNWDSSSFFLSKDRIEKTDIFKIIRRMPKGGALHVHELAAGQGRWVVKNATYRENVHMCQKDGLIKFAIFTRPPPDADCSWRPVSTMRAASGDPMAFDEMLIRNISMLTTDPLETYATITDVWNRFNGYFDQVMSLLYNDEIMKDYIYDAFQQFYDDNVQYLELRAVPNSIFRLDSQPSGTECDVRLYKDVAERFAKDHHDFSGVKLIPTGLRVLPVDAILYQVKETIALRQKYPDFLIGYDLVGQEDPNYSLEYYLDALLYPSQQDPPADLPYFFHAAETNWQGTAVDYNIVDALLLNTSRIGHGYGLVKHPKLAEIVKARGVAIEVNPISNQLLGLVKDLRNHGVVPLLADDFPVVISSDDPGTWDALPLSHDFYVAFMDMCGRDDGLSFLKQLARNSLEYSMMAPTEKQTALALWETKWDAFIKDMAEEIRKKTDVSPPPGTEDMEIYSLPTPVPILQSSTCTCWISG